MKKKVLTDYEKKAKFMVLICWLAYATVYVGKKNFNQCQPQMIADGLSETWCGAIGACFLACYAAGQFINGWIGEKLHPKNMICGGLILAGFFNILMGFTPVSSPLLIAIVWGACGFACSMLWAPILRAVSIWTPASIAADAAASLSLTIPVGTITTYIVCTVAFWLSGWRAAFIAVMATWVVVYFFSTVSWRFLIKGGDKKPVPAIHRHARASPVEGGQLGVTFVIPLVIAGGKKIFPAVIGKLFFKEPEPRRMAVIEDIPGKQEAFGADLLRVGKELMKRLSGRYRMFRVEGLVKRLGKGSSLPLPALFLLFGFFPFLPGR